MTGATNADKLPLFSSIARRIFSEQEQQDERVPKALPTEITGFGKNKTTVKIKFSTDQSFTLPTDIEIPINGTRYMRYPWQIGDKGYVVPSQIDAWVNSGQSDNKTAPFAINANLASLVFHPLGNLAFEAPDDPNAVQHNAPTGVIARDDNKKGQLITHPDNGTSIQHGGDGKGNYDHNVSALNGVAVKTKKEHTIDATNTTLDKPGNLTTQKNITSQSGNISAPIGTVSGLAGQFASGSMGNMQFGSGGMSGAPTSNGFLSITPTQAAAPVIQSNAIFTVAELNEQYPPSIAIRGMRAVVSDALAVTTVPGGNVTSASSTASDTYNPAPGSSSQSTTQSQPSVSTTVETVLNNNPPIAFMSVLVGGGAITAPAWCDGVNWLCA